MNSSREIRSSTVSCRSRKKERTEKAGKKNPSAVRRDFHCLGVGIGFEHEIEVLQQYQRAECRKRFSSDYRLCERRGEIRSRGEARERDERKHDNRAVRIEILRTFDNRGDVEERNRKSEERQDDGLRSAFESDENLGTHQKEQACEHCREKQRPVKERLPIDREIYVEKIEKVHIRGLFGGDERTADVAGSKTVDILDAAYEEREFFVFREGEGALVHDSQVLSEGH